jgi:hypothetical protein
LYSRPNRPIRDHTHSTLTPPEQHLLQIKPSTSLQSFQKQPNHPALASSSPAQTFQKPSKLRHQHQSLTQPSHFPRAAGTQTMHSLANTQILSHSHHITTPKLPPASFQTSQTSQTPHLRRQPHTHTPLHSTLIKQFLPRTSSPLNVDAQERTRSQGSELKP